MGGEWLTPRPGRFTPGKREPVATVFIMCTSHNMQEHEMDWTYR